MYRDNDPFLAFGGKIDPLSEIRNAGIVTSGSVLWVKQTADVDYVTLKDQVGRDNFFDTLQEAVDKTRNDRSDFVMVTPADANAVYNLGTALDLNKDRVHMIGVGYTRAKNSYSITVRGGYGTLPDTEVVAVQGDGVEVSGIRFLGTLGTNDGGTMTNGVAFISGHDFWAKSCVFEDSTTLWGTPPVVRGDGTGAHDARFDDCRFVISTSGIESAGNSALVIGGDGNKRWEFNDSKFLIAAGSVTETFFTPGTGAKVYTEFNRCHFGLVAGTAFAITSAVRGSVTANNPVLLNNCTGLSITAFGTDTSVFAAPSQSGTAGAGFHNPGLYAVGTGLRPVA